MNLTHKVELIGGPLCGDSVGIALRFRPGHNLSLYFIPEYEEHSMEKQKGFVVYYTLESYGFAFFNKYEDTPF